MKPLRVGDKVVFNGGIWSIEDIGEGFNGPAYCLIADDGTTRSIAFEDEVEKYVKAVPHGWVKLWNY